MRVNGRTKPTGEMKVREGAVSGPPPEGPIPGVCPGWGVVGSSWVGGALDGPLGPSQGPRRGEPLSSVAPGPGGRPRAHRQGLIASRGDVWRCTGPWGRPAGLWGPTGEGGSSSRAGVFVSRGAGPGLARTARVAPVERGGVRHRSASTWSRHVRTRKMVNYAWPG